MLAVEMLARLVWDTAIAVEQERQSHQEAGAGGKVLVAVSEEKVVGKQSCC